MKTILNGRRAIGVVILCAFIAVSAAGASEPSAGSAAWLDGRWYHDGKPTRILVAPDGRSITIINELGQRSDGYANGSGNLVIPSLRIRGEVSRKGRRISWTNGTEWTREATTPGPQPGLNISGRWFRNGMPTSISMASDGRNFTIRNEWGLRASGYINRNGELKVPAWVVTGQLNRNEQRISWSNGTEWTRLRLR